MNRNFVQRLRVNHFRYRLTLLIENRRATFSISSRWRLRNRTKSKIFGFSKTAPRISMKIKLRCHFSILFKLRISKARKSNLKKIDFSKISPICKCKGEKIRKFSISILKFFYNWSSILESDFFCWFSANPRLVDWRRSLKPLASLEVIGWRRSLKPLALL